MYFQPRKKFIHIFAFPTDPDGWKKKIEEGGLVATVSGKAVKVTADPGQFDAHRALIDELLEQTAKDSFT